MTPLLARSASTVVVMMRLFLCKTTFELFGHEKHPIATMLGSRCVFCPYSECSHSERHQAVNTETSLQSSLLAVTYFNDSLPGSQKTHRFPDEDCLNYAIFPKREPEETK